MRIPGFTQALTAAVLAAALSGCTARTNVGLGGTAPDDVAHLWVTIDELAFATEADTPLEDETGWQIERFSNPVVVDLAGIGPDKLVALATNLSVPAGDYRQLRLGFAEAGERLVPAARDLGLDYNSQIDVRNGDGSIAVAPLEFPVPGAGLTIPVDLTLRAGTGSDDLTNLAITLDAARDVLRYAYGQKTGYILSPQASVADAGKSGMIAGTVDTSGLRVDAPPIYVSAQRRDKGGANHRIVQRRRIAADGSFALYPLPAPTDGSQAYDVVITGAGSDTVIVRDVPVTAGTEPTVVQSTPILLTPATTVYADVGEQTPALPSGARVDFYQALPGGDEPYLIDGTSLDPVTREVEGGRFGLSAGALVAGSYADGGPIVFSAVTPSEGNGGFRVGSSGTYRADTLARSAVAVSGGSGRPTRVTVPYPDLASGGRAGTLSVTLQAPIGQFDSGFVTVWTGPGVVDTVDVSTLIERGGGLVTITGLPGGTQLAPPLGVPYKVALRAWNSRNASGTLTSASSLGSARLGDAGVGALLLRAP